VLVHPAAWAVDAPDADLRDGVLHGAEALHANSCGGSSAGDTGLTDLLV
jgi:hypothetical protein